MLHIYGAKKILFNEIRDKVEKIASLIKFFYGRFFPAKIRINERGAS